MNRFRCVVEVAPLQQEKKKEVSFFFLLVCSEEEGNKWRKNGHVRAMSRSTFFLLVFLSRPRFFFFFFLPYKKKKIYETKDRNPSRGGIISLPKCIHVMLFVCLLSLVRKKKEKKIACRTLSGW